MKLNRSKSGIKDGTEKNFKFLSYIVGDSNYQNNFPDKLFIEVWFTNQNSKPLEIERKININLVINESVKYKQ